MWPMYGSTKHYAPASRQQPPSYRPWRWPVARSCCSRPPRRVLEHASRILGNFSSPLPSSSPKGRSALGTRHRHSAQDGRRSPVGCAAAHGLPRHLSQSLRAGALLRRPHPPPSYRLIPTLSAPWEARLQSSEFNFSKKRSLEFRLEATTPWEVEFHSSD
jgi:hypothetical protein